MRALTSRDLLRAWEEALDQPGVLRAIPLLAVSCDVTPHEAGQWSIARRDAALFDLRIQLFGRQADALVQCPRCAERMEMRLDLGEMRPARPAKRAACTTRVGGYVVRYRAPNSTDLLSIVTSGDAQRARVQLLERCVESVALAGRRRALATVPPEVAEGVAQRISKEQAEADVRLRLTCANCGHAWEEPFDIARFLWREVDAWARRTFRDVHALARAYGWGETDILNLSARRRRMYLDLIGAS
jgi:hypothetical protein